MTDSTLTLVEVGEGENSTGRSARVLNATPTQYENQGYNKWSKAGGVQIELLDFTASSGAVYNEVHLSGINSKGDVSPIRLIVARDSLPAVIAALQGMLPR